MKFKSIFAVAAALTCVVGAAPVYSAAVLPYVSAASADSGAVSFQSVEEAAVFMRGQFKARNSSFSFTMPVSYFDSQDMMRELLPEALKETGVSDEGDYIRYSIRSIGFRYKGNSKSTAFTINTEYFTDASMERAVTEKVSQVMKQLDLSGKSDYEKISAIYKYITGNVKYASGTSDTVVYSAYGALINHNAVCQGYSLLLYRLATEAGISCRIIAGTAGSVGHAWNIAGIDGKYYLLDSTWDSGLSSSSYRFFLRGTGDFDQYSGSQKHEAAVGEEVNRAMYPDYTSAEFNSAYPVASAKYVYSKQPSSYILGDVNGDTVVDGTDATLVLKAYAEMSAFGRCGLSQAQIQAGDVDKNGAVDGTDATIILKYYSRVSGDTNITIEQCIYS